jgi:hypothetical protein
MELPPFVQRGNGLSGLLHDPFSIPTDLSFLNDPGLPAQAAGALRDIGFPDAPFPTLPRNPIIPNPVTPQSELERLLRIDPRTGLSSFLGYFTDNYVRYGDRVTRSAEQSLQRLNALQATAENLASSTANALNNFSSFNPSALLEKYGVFIVGGVLIVLFATQK